MSVIPPGIDVERARRYLRNENHRWPARLVKIPRSQWPARAVPPGVFEVWRSSRFLVQVYREPNEIVRLSVCTTWVDAAGKYEDGISWDDLQRLKNECGFGDRDAVEIYPADRDVVNVANMRHLWVLPDALPFKWAAKKPEVQTR